MPELGELNGSGFLSGYLFFLRMFSRLDFHFVVCLYSLFVDFIGYIFPPAWKIMCVCVMISVSLAV